jgi:hypothetical protein
MVTRSLLIYRRIRLQKSISKAIALFGCSFLGRVDASLWGVQSGLRSVSRRGAETQREDHVWK